MYMAIAPARTRTEVPFRRMFSCMTRNSMPEPAIITIRWPASMVANRRRLCVTGRTRKLEMISIGMTIGRM